MDIAGVGHFPLVIEPVVQVLELHDTGAAGWAQWPRIPVEQILHKVTPPAGVVHWFGSSPDLNNCNLAIGYNVAGQISHLLVFYEEEWGLQPFPPEAIGRTDLRPYVRLVFKTERAQNAFLQYLHQVRKGAMPNPTIELLLGQLDGSPLAGLCGVLRQPPHD